MQQALGFFSELLEVQPYERNVTTKLSEGLDAAAQAVEKFNLEHNPSEFDKAVERGVSANLCDAVSRLASDGNGVDVSITWAKTRPSRLPRWSRKFTRAEGEMLGEVARTFKLKQPRPDEKLEGFIVDLHRNQSDALGRVTLRTNVDGKPTSIRFDLDANDYALATRAHGEKSLIAIEGDLEREGQRWTLIRPKNLIEIPSELTSQD